MQTQSTSRRYSMSVSVERDLEIKKIDKKNERYYDGLAKWYEPYDRLGKPLRKNLPETLAQYRKGRKRRRSK